MPDRSPPPAYCIPHAADAEEHFLRWQAHVDAGRIGTRAPADPAIAADRAQAALVPERDIS